MGGIFAVTVHGNEANKSTKVEPNSETVHRGFLQRAHAGLGRGIETGCTAMSSSRGQRASSANEEERTVSRTRSGVARCSGRRARRFLADSWPPPEGSVGGSSGDRGWDRAHSKNPQAGGIFVERRRRRRADSISHATTRREARRGMILWDVSLCLQALARGIVHPSLTMHPKKRGHH